PPTSTLFPDTTLFRSMPCIQALVPYNFEVRPGVLPMGEFEVKIAGTDVKSTLVITEATNAGPDDFLYAPVDSVSVDENDDGNSRSEEHTSELQSRENL